MKHKFEKTEGGIPTKTLDVVVSGTGGKSILEELYELQSNLKCWCHRCCEEQTGYQQMFKMVVCPTCGNKRCPRATSCKLECTGSNSSGQEGSVYQ